MAKTGYGNFVYIMEGYWRDVLHKWQIPWNHSGAAFGPADAEAFMTGAESPFALTFSPFICLNGPKCVGARYYNGTASSPVWEADYDQASPAPANLVPTGAAFANQSPPYCPIEVCTMLEAPLGLGKTGKPVFLRKFIRGLPTGTLTTEAGGSSVIDYASGAQASAQTATDGSWYENRVAIAPSGAQAPSGSMAAGSQPGNHQVPRGRKRGTRSTSPTTILGDIRQILADGGGDE